MISIVLVVLGRKSSSQPSGSEAPTRPRPVLLKVSSAWDRRLILSTVRKLRDYAVKRIFIREDLSPVEQLKRREAFLARTSSVSNPPRNARTEASDQPIVVPSVSDSVQ